MNDCCLFTWSIYLHSINLPGDWILLNSMRNVEDLIYQAAIVKYILDTNRARFQCDRLKKIKNTAV
jgi:hypothetical protein